MGLAGTGAADQHGVALLGDEAAAGEVIDQRLVDGCSLELEVLKILGKRQLGDGELVLDRSRLLPVDLGVEQVADDALGFVLALDGGRHDLIEGGLHIENDIGGMDAVGDHLGTGRLDGGQTVGQNRVEDVDHLPIAIVGASELTPYTFNRRGQYPVFQGSAITQGAGLASQHRDVISGIVESSRRGQMSADARQRRVRPGGSRCGRHRHGPQPGARRRWS
jgi:hypothetical protein